MKKVAVFSALLVAGLMGGQISAGSRRAVVPAHR